MTREELHTFAAAGVAQKIAGIERELATYHKEWPELFISVTAPQLLKPALKTGISSNGHGPTTIAPATKRANSSHAATEARIETLRTLLATGPKTLADLTAALAAKGQALSSTALQKALRHGVNATVTRTDGHFYWSVADAPKKPGQRGWSAAARRKMSLHMKRRWKSGEIGQALKKARAARGN